MTVRIPPANASAKSEVYTIDFRETAPALANTTMYRAYPQSAAFGGLAVGVPGEVRGLEEAHRRWGTLPWKRLLEPSISLAAGWEVDKELGNRIPASFLSQISANDILSRLQWYTKLMLNNPDWSSIFAPKGRLLKEGEKISRANLSRTLSTISKEGANAFYTVLEYGFKRLSISNVFCQGAIADSIVRKVRSEGGIITHADLENYTVKVDRALEGSYRGRKVYTSHAPTSGPGTWFPTQVL